MKTGNRRLSNGSKLAIVLAGGGILIALLAAKFRVFQPPATQPATIPSQK
jgi:hypothetical protein